MAFCAILSFEPFKFFLSRNFHILLLYLNILRVFFSTIIFTFIPQIFLIFILYFAHLIKGRISLCYDLCSKYIRNVFLWKPNCFGYQNIKKIHQTRMTSNPCGSSTSSGGRLLGSLKFLVSSWMILAFGILIFRQQQMLFKVCHDLAKQRREAEATSEI